ncbi:MAG: alpha/beta hydrolase [Lentisphaerae bacterium]|nr:alpha/beta hydrolase [Lentisphaerota bacterium]
MPELAWSVIRIAVAVYAGLCFLVLFRQGRYVYFPDREIGLTPEALNMAYDDVVLQTQDGVRITGWFVPGAPDGALKRRLTLLFCHGNGGDIGDRVGSIKVFHDMGFDVFIFDYRGYGHSTGRPSEHGTYLDAQAAWNYLKGTRSVAPQDIVVFGRSLGGAVAAWLAEQVNPGALFLESTFTSAKDMAQRMFPLLPGRLLCRYDYNAVDRVGRVRCPVFVTHSREDEMIPFRHGERIFEGAREPKAFCELTGSHNAGGFDIHPDCRQALAAFLNEHL